MAAGFSLKEENIAPLRKALNENTVMTGEDLIPKVVIDVPMPVDYITEELTDQLSLLEPFGKSNEKPVFADRNLLIRHARVLGKDRNVVRMELESANHRVIEGVYFGNPDDLRLSVAEKYGMVKAQELMEGKRMDDIRMHMTYYPDKNCYQGFETLQLKISGFC